jgi:hypothetical protein
MGYAGGISESAPRTIAAIIAGGHAPGGVSTGGGKQLRLGTAPTACWLAMGYLQQP